MAEPVQSAREYDLSFFDFPIRIKIPFVLMIPQLRIRIPCSRDTIRPASYGVVLELSFLFLSFYISPPKQTTEQTTEHQRADVIFLFLALAYNVNPCIYTFCLQFLYI